MFGISEKAAAINHRALLDSDSSTNRWGNQEHVINYVQLN